MARIVKLFLLGLLLCVSLARFAQATKAIAVWAVSDKYPVTGTAHIGVSAYHESGVSVTIKIGGTEVGTITQEEINPGTGYPEYFVTINTKDYSDGDHTLDATATPVSGTALNLDQITLRIANTFQGKHYYVDAANGLDSGDGCLRVPDRRHVRVPDSDLCHRGGHRCHGRGRVLLR